MSTSTTEAKPLPPTVFISYSWTDQNHQNRIKEWADRLLADGVNVILDLYDLKEGDDIYAFMERMVTDAAVTHVLIISDRKYAERANAREKGVGTESQIISKEVYAKVTQSKFVPVVCEFAEDGTPYLPVFLKTRYWIDFSSPEKVNERWEQLIRVLFGKPLHQKPIVGQPPAFLSNAAVIPSSPALSKFATLQQAINQNRPGLARYREDFLGACIEYADALRVRSRPDVKLMGEKVLEDCGKLTTVRNLLVDWILLEAQTTPQREFTEAVVTTLERLRELKARPSEVNEWNDAWFEAHKLFVFECFLYFVAALIKTGSHDCIHEIYTSHYLTPQTERYKSDKFDRFDCFYAYSDTLNRVLAPEGQRLLSPAAELVKRQANRKDVTFANLIEADLLTLLMSFLIPNTRWFPQLMYYSQYGHDFPLFLRATQHKHFQKLAVITGVTDANELRKRVGEAQENLKGGAWSNFYSGNSFSESLNLEKLDTAK